MFILCYNKPAFVLFIFTILQTQKFKPKIQFYND